MWTFKTWNRETIRDSIVVVISSSLSSKELSKILNIETIRDSNVAVLSVQ